MPKIVVVGNLTVGGTGKTPVIIGLARFLLSQGLSVGIVSRGYKGLVAKSKTAILLDEYTTVSMVGDEPYLVYQETNVPVAVHPKRKLAVLLLMKRFKLDVILSDDGLQHYALPRMLELVVMDAKRQFGNGFCLPLGPLREPPSRLKSVDFILMNQSLKTVSPALETVTFTSVGANETSGQGLAAEQDQHWALVEKCYQDKSYDFYVQAQALIQVGVIKAIHPLDYLRGLRCHAVAGIANPQRFFATLLYLGADIVPHMFPDHHHFSPEDFIFEEALPIIMTQKDAVKCEAFNLVNAFALEVSAMFSPEFLRAFLNKLGYNSFH